MNAMTERRIGNNMEVTLKSTVDGELITIPVKTIEYFVADQMEDVGESFKILDEIATEVSQTLRINTTYWQMLWLADKVEPQNKKKAKQIRNAAERHNPLRIMGLLK